MLTCNNILKKMHDIHVRQLAKRLWTLVHFFEPGTKKLPSEVQPPLTKLIMKGGRQFLMKDIVFLYPLFRNKLLNLNLIFLFSFSDDPQVSPVASAPTAPTGHVTCSSLSGRGSHCSRNHQWNRPGHPGRRQQFLSFSNMGKNFKNEFFIKFR